MARKTTDSAHDSPSIQSPLNTSFSDGSDQDAAQKAPHPPWKLSRRTLLIGGLVTGAALVGGGLFVRSHLSQPRHSTTVNKHPLLDMSWNGLDYAWLSGGTHIAYVSNHGLSIVDVKSGKQVSFNTSDTYAAPITWSADGTRLACVAQNQLVALDVQSGRNLWTYQDAQHPIQTASISPDGTRLALVRYQSPSTGASPDSNFQVWSVEAGTMISQHPEASVISGIAWSPDSSHAAVTSQEGSVGVWNVADGRLVWSYQAGAGPAGVISWSPDGSLIAFASNGLVGTWDARTGKTLFQAEADIGDPTEQDRHNRSAVWSPDGTRIAFWSKARNGQAIQVYSARSGQRLFTCERVEGLLSSLTWSPDGKYLAAGSYIVGDGGELARGDNGDRSVIQFWDAQNGEVLFTYSAPKSPDHLSWSSDSHLLAFITPKVYASSASSACQSLCRYGYQNPALQVFQIA